MLLHAEVRQTLPTPTPQVRLGLTIVGPATGPDSIWPTVAKASLGIAAIGLLGWVLFG